jgi:hypothetical protein
MASAVLLRDIPWRARCDDEPREGALDDVGRARMLTVLRREVAKSEQRVTILGEAIDRLLVLDAPCLDEGIEGCERVLLGPAIQISWNARLAFGCWLFGSLLSTLAVLCTQQRWPRVGE